MMSFCSKFLVNFAFLFICFALLFFTIADSQESSQLNDHSLSCTFVQTHTTGRKIVYRNWPFKLSCSGLEPKGIVSSSTQTQCFVQSDNLPRQSADTSITLDNNSKYLVTFTVTQVINRSTCFSRNTTVELRPLPSRSCYEDVKYFADRNVNVKDTSVVSAEIMNLECLPSTNAGNEAILPPAVPSSQYTTTWWRSKRLEDSSITEGEACQNYSHLAKNSLFVDQIKHRGQPDSLLVYNVNFYHPAVYTCEVRYNGHSAFVSHHSVCVKNRIYRTRPVVLCNKIKYAFRGDTVKIECSVQSSNAKVEKNDLEVRWTKEDGDVNHRCNNLYVSRRGKEQGSKISCNLKNFKNFGIKCFYHVPTDKELSMVQDRNVFKIVYTLRNFNPSDAGRYKVLLRYKDEWSEERFIELRYKGSAVREQLQLLWRLMSKSN